VKLYIKNVGFSRSSRPYRCAIWSRCETSFKPRDAMFTFTDQDGEIYDFPYLDRLIAGLEKKQLLWKDRLLFWRTRFLVLPSPIWDAKALINTKSVR
jgi:hypothetical protein